MSTLEIILLGILAILAMILAVLWANLSTIADKLQDISRNIFWLREEDDE